ncbi:ATP-dependent DEAD/H RNA helicase [Trypanosoma rangeli]|uniref:ATP-dependent DEAD/H RNA helicase n=1 Tax=Trypanosoma rangeli TaxID=5698 RepID=A0A422NC36_TRYRA|nr:ATP-dependent DEAD/H RNA helicase [Trypanosoma rangeli]RNF03064.1 ATP-dependent DEAD/H RNA helicase [Trypanosoma rangeli]|eukprot:RNF03064.1 ATP-dependent DEAD/H RNA helicase [Trypanosoma rangeli]
MCLVLFAYQSYIRAYMGNSRELKAHLFFLISDVLNLGHVAQSFGIDKKLSEVRAQLWSFVREGRKIARESSSLTTQEEGKWSDDFPSRRRLQVEVRHDDRYRSMVAQEQRNVKAQCC